MRCAIAVLAALGLAVTLAGCILEESAGPVATKKTLTCAGAQMQAPASARSPTTGFEVVLPWIWQETTVTGPTYRGQGAKTVKFDPVAITDAKASAGGMSFEGWPIPGPSAMRPLILIGGLCVVAGVVLGWLAGWGLGLCLSAGGVALIATAVLFDKYPWVAMAPVVAGAGFAAWAAYALWRGRDSGDSLQAIVQAIESLDPKDQEIVKGAVAMTGNIKGNARKIKKTVSRVKGN